MRSFLEDDIIIENVEVTTVGGRIPSPGGAGDATLGMKGVVVDKVIASA